MISRRITALTVALALSGSAAGAQLNPADTPFSIGPLDGSGISIVAHPQNSAEVLVIRYTKGLFRSTDGGQTFAAYGTGYTGALRDLTTDPQDSMTIYGLDGAQVLRSTDFGASWSPLGLVANMNLKSIAVPTSGNSLLASDAFNVYLSTDGGATWSVTHSVVPFGGKVLDELHFAPSDPQVAYLTYGQGILRSGDGGQTFAQSGPWAGFAQSLTVLPTDANTIVVGAAFEGTLRSTDGGATMTLLGTGLPGGQHPRWFHWDPNGTTLWASSLTELATSFDLGSTWTLELTGIVPGSVIPGSIDFAPDGTQYLGVSSNSLAGGGGGFFTRASSQVPWDHTGFVKEHIQHLAIAGPNGKRILSLDSGIHVGNSGSEVTPTAYYAQFAMPSRALAVDPTDPDYWIVGTKQPVEAFEYTRIIVMTQSGANFAETYAGAGLGPVEAIEYDPFDPNVVVAGVRSWSPGAVGVLHSTDRGGSWTEVSGTADWMTVDIAFDPTTPGRVLQLSEDSQWSFSLDGGASWSPQQSGWPGPGEATFVAFDPFVAGRLYMGDDVGGLWTSDDWSNWTALGVTLHPESELLLHPDVPGLLWVSSANGAVLVSADGGQSFEAASTLYPGVLATDLALDTANGNLVVGTDGASAWELPNASPYVGLGGGTQGSGGYAPRHFPAGGLPRVGNFGWQLSGDQLVGGAGVALFVGLADVPAPAVGGIYHVGFKLVTFPASASGAGAGDGSFSVSVPIAPDPFLVGLSIVSQFGAIDAGAADPSGIVLSDGLRTTLLP